MGFARASNVVQTVGPGYRLPTDTEWEYAARGGLVGKRFPWGDTISHDNANFRSVGSEDYDVNPLPKPGYHPTYANGSTPYTSPVGAFAPNGYGLYDVTGNLLEWCFDWSPGAEDPERVTRGGSWKSKATDCLVGYQRGDWVDSPFNDIGFRTAMDLPLDGMVLIPGGTNSGMNPDPDLANYSLTVNRFYMDKYLVTKGKWDDVHDWAVTNGYSFDNDLYYGEVPHGQGKAVNHPVHTVNWYDCVKWCNARSEKEGRPAVYYANGNIYRSGQSNNVTLAAVPGYRLPTDTEWEYAARGGLVSKRFPWGDTITHNEANYASAPYTYSYDDNPTFGFHPIYMTEEPYTNPVDAFEPNAFGLFDMAGNLSEWCYNWYPSYEGSRRVLRGGSWHNHPDMCRAGNRSQSLSDVASKYIGFRTVLSPGQ